jgi:imidazolonepropionase
MLFVWSLACIQMRMSPEQALCALTLNGARALNASHEVGSLSVGKQADLIISKPIEQLARIPYSFTENLIESVIIRGEIQSMYHTYLPNLHV